MKTPRENDFITNSDESKVVPDENPEPLEGIKTDEHGTKPQKPDADEDKETASEKKQE